MKVTLISLGVKLIINKLDAIKAGHFRLDFFLPVFCRHFIRKKVIEQLSSMLPHRPWLETGRYGRALTKNRCSVLTQNRILTSKINPGQPCATVGSNPKSPERHREKGIGAPVFEWCLLSVCSTKKHHVRFPKISSNRSFCHDFQDNIHFPLYQMVGKYG
jgi:hypothetical protein